MSLVWLKEKDEIEGEFETLSEYGGEWREATHVRMTVREYEALTRENANLRNKLQYEKINSSLLSKQVEISANKIVDSLMEDADERVARAEARTAEVVHRLKQVQAGKDQCISVLQERIDRMEKALRNAGLDI